MNIFEKEEERKNLLDILKNSRKALRTDDVLLLRDMSNRTVHSSSISKDPDSIAIAVTIYALAKITERKKYTTYREWPSFFKRIGEDIDSAIISIEKKDIAKFRDYMHNIRIAVDRLSGHLKIYIQDVFRKASINKASRIYEHGISMQETARLLDVTQWELAEYVGATGIADVDLSLTMPIKDRLNLAKKLFEK